MRRWSAALVLSVVGSGCYVRNALETAPLPGTAVRVMLKPGAAGELADLIGPQATALEGQVLSSTPDTLVLRMSRVLRQDETAEPWLGERVALAQGLILNVEARRLSAERSVLLGAGAMAGLLVLFKAFIKEPKPQGTP